jgi:outer membrane protein TolC
MNGVVTGLVVLWLAAAAQGRGQQPAPAAPPPPPAPPAGPPLTLGEVVAAALENNTEVRLAQVEAERARGALLAAAEPFDTSIGTSVAASRQHSYSPTSAQASELRQVSVGVDVTQRFRAGIVVAPELLATRSVIAAAPGQSASATQGSARLKVLVPLLRDRGGALTGGPEQVARGASSASARERRHAAASGVLGAAAAYWDYLAAQRQLEVLMASEARAERTARETGALVQADERTRTDRIQAEGHLAARRADRLAAEREVVGAWENLAAAMGLERADLALLPAPSTDFPAARAESAPAAGSLDRWLAAAPARRDDWAAAQWRLRAAEAALRSSRSELEPRLDLEASGGFTHQERDRPLGRLFQPLVDGALDQPALDAAVSLRFELPLPRSGARGRVAQAAAGYERERIAAAHVQRAIRNGIAVTAETVRRTQLGLRHSEEAVRLLGETVENERKKFRLGYSTLFAVIQAEESLTSALLSRIAGQRAHAIALARLRFETGTVLTPGSDGTAAPAAPTVAASLLVLP